MKLNKLNPTGRMGVLQHLAELRSRIIRSSLAVAIGTIIGWVFYPEILSFILDPYCQTLGTDCTLRVDEPLEGLNTRFMVSIYTGVICEDDVFLGPSMVFTNVINPRSGVIRKQEFMKTIVKKGASIGANATIKQGVTIGKNVIIGSGSVVLNDVPDDSVFVGNPAKYLRKNV